jgi:hypothetical protein
MGNRRKTTSLKEFLKLAIIASHCNGDRSSRAHSAEHGKHANRPAYPDSLDGQIIAPVSGNRDFGSVIIVRRHVRSPVEIWWTFVISLSFEIILRTAIDDWIFVCSERDGSNEIAKFGAPRF